MLEYINEIEWLIPAVVSLAILIAGFFVSFLTFRLIRFITKRSTNPTVKRVVDLGQYPFKTLIFLIAINFIKINLQINYPEVKKFEHFIYLIFLAIFAWMSISVVNAIQTGMVYKYKININEDVKSRKIYTQIKVFKNILVFLILFFTISVALLSFETIKQLGVSLLASAGVAGVIIGFAAQKSISMLLSGFQLAITQPIKLDDVVIVEGERGRVEEITLTYVVVVLWDMRRMVLPVNYFIDQPFQNWTHKSTDLIGDVILFVDYSMPIEKLREYMTESLKNNPHWDGKVNRLIVTDCTEKSMQLRALASAKDTSSTRALQNELREDLISFIQKNYPNSLPKTRYSLL